LGRSIASGVLRRSRRILVLYVAGILTLGGWAAVQLTHGVPRKGRCCIGEPLYTPHPTFQAGISRIRLADRGVKMTEQRITGHPRTNGPDAVASDCHFEIG
jgi:hypothetical protein